MLTGAARRHAKLQLSRHIVAATLEQLQLPWLSAGSHNALDFRRTSSSAPPRSHSRHKLRDSSPGRFQPHPLPAPSRNLATEAYIPERADNYIPFEGILSHQLPPPTRQPPGESGWDSSVLRPFDPSSLVIVQSQEWKPPFEVKRTRSSSLPNDITLLHENLYALVRVARFEQAERVVRRLIQIYEPNSPELIDAHHRYLTGRLEALLEDPQSQHFSAMQRWFELDVRARHCTPNSGILAIMIKASIAVLQGSRLDRTIRRYMSIAEQIGSDVKYDTISSGIFLDSEWTLLLRLFPQEYNTPLEYISDQDIELQVQSMAKGEMAPLLTLDKPPTELRAMEQKGLGLKALKRSLQSLTSRPSDPDALHQEGKSEAYLRQERLERDAIDSAMERWREEAQDTQRERAKGQLGHPLLGAHAYEWINQMAKAVREDIKLAEAFEGSPSTANTRDAERLVIAPFLKLADPTKLCAATVMDYISFVTNPRDVSVTDRALVRTVDLIGGSVAKEISLDITKRSLLEKYHSLPSALRQKRTAEIMKNSRNWSSMRSGADHLESASTTNPLASIDKDIKIKLGAYFLSLLLKYAKLPITKINPATGREVTQVQPIAHHSSKWSKGRQTSIVRTNPGLIERLKREPTGSFIAKHLPMTIEPLPWKGLKEGGYLHTKIAPIRFRDDSNSQQEYAGMASVRGDMRQVYAGLDVIGKVPWRINRDLFNVLAEVWNTGEAVGGLALENPPDNTPPRPDETDAAAVRRWKKINKAAQDERSGFHSQRCYQNFQLEVARAFLNETFYCPHSTDFRGRAYPIPPYFNHMGADYVRGLFLFARGKELGENGMRWLKIHLSNVFGFDKASLREREQFATDHMSDIIDSASNPMGGQRWWLTAEDPWQCLAACLEIKKAIESGDPTKFVSHLPIQQDGTCNGLQHYAALGGDIIGAQQVNLTPGERPADIYSAVADMVKTFVHEDALAGNKSAQLLDGKIARKVVKQPVMTNVYGVTFHGARAQVHKQLVDIMPKETLDNDIDLGVLSGYIATLIFKALSRMFTGAHAIQTWLGQIGELVSSSLTPEQVSRIAFRRENAVTVSPSKSKKATPAFVPEDSQFSSTIVWTTPLGMPVVQPYRAKKRKNIHTTLKMLQVYDSSMSEAVSKRKQLQAFPPNFIHSLDATHMMLSALKCDEIGLQFSSVHDSFWTHAADVSIMNRILRDAFVRMHSEDVIGRLREEFLVRYKGCMTYRSIDAASPLGRKISALRKAKGVSKSRFVASAIRDGPQIDELLEETERQRLLNSEDPADREKGKAMITPASLFDADSEASKYLLGAARGHGVQLLGDESSESNSASSTRSSSRSVKIQGSGSHDAYVPGVQMSAEDHEVDVEESDKLDKDEAENEDWTDVDMSTEIVESKTSKSAKAKKPTMQKTHIWMPITFPAAPKRGEFDVSELKESQYFFS